MLSPAAASASAGARPAPFTSFVALERTDSRPLTWVDLAVDGPLEVLELLAPRGHRLHRHVGDLVANIRVGVQVQVERLEMLAL